MDKESDDLHDDLLDLFNRSDEGAAGLDTVAKNDGRNEDSKQRVGGHGVDDVVWDQRIEHVNDHFVNLERRSLIDRLLVFLGGCQLIATDRNHEFGPHQADKESRMRDRNDGGEHVISDSPPGKLASLAATLGHIAEALDSHDHCGYNHRKDCKGQRTKHDETIKVTDRRLSRHAATTGRE